MLRSSVALLVLLAVPAMGCAQEAGDRALVRQLADPARRARAAAHADLLKRGKNALPALTETLKGRLNGGDAQQVAIEALHVLSAMGPEAGGAVPDLLAVVDPDASLATELIETLAELAPWRSPDVDVGPRDVGILIGRSHGNGGRGRSSRLSIRLAFPVEADVATLAEIASGSQAYRVELAVEVLGRRGPRAIEALPVLLRLLDLPDPKTPDGVGKVELRTKTSNAILSISPEGEPAKAARQVLLGRPPATPIERPLPERARTRIGELVAQLGDGKERAAAVANLVAMGSISVPALIGVLKTSDERAVLGALDALRGIGPKGCEAAFTIRELLTKVPLEHTDAVLDALAATGPWSRDIVELAGWGNTADSMSFGGKDVPGRGSVELINALMAKAHVVAVALEIDPRSPTAHLADLLVDPFVLKRERALEILATRGASAKSALPAIERAMVSDHPDFYTSRFLDNGSGTTEREKRSENVQTLAAQCILAIAEPSDPLAEKAREVLKRH